MNPRSGGGKVAKFGLKDKAEKLGAEVALLEGPGTVDVAALARKAVADGADLLGVAGGDGTQALVAGIAAEHGLPFLVISAGTRNHFALDLGLDRDDPSTCLNALTDGEELRVDLGIIGDRTFVNNASFGAYAEVVRSPAYRDDKRGTTLQVLPGLLNGHQGAPAVRPGRCHPDRGPAGPADQQRPVRDERRRRPGRRARLDAGALGVVAVQVDSARARLRAAISGAASVTRRGAVRLRLRLGFHLRKASVIVRELVEVRPGDLRRHGDVVIGHIGLRIARAVLELDVHPFPELLQIERRRVPVNADPLARGAGLIEGKARVSCHAVNTLP